jgi:hypothetical protein
LGRCCPSRACPLRTRARLPALRSSTAAAIHLKCTPTRTHAHASTPVGPYLMPALPAAPTMRGCDTRGTAPPPERAPQTLAAAGIRCSLPCCGERGPCSKTRRGAKGPASDQLRQGGARLLRMRRVAAATAAWHPCCPRPLTLRPGCLAMRTTRATPAAATPCEGVSAAPP